jgi:hypothetical protein
MHSQKIKCDICGKEYSIKGIYTHKWRSHGEGQNHNPNKGYEDGTRQIWNKGLNKETDERVKNAGETYSDNYKNGLIIHHHTPPGLEARKRTSERMSLFNTGGKSKWFDYFKKDGTKIKLQGTWEVRFAKILDKIDENWIKPGLCNKSHSFNWKNNKNEEHIYTPDFYSPKFNKYFEVKGYWWGDDKNKMKYVIEQNPTIIIDIIEKKELLLMEQLFLR